MSTEFRLNYLRKLCKLNRAIYIFFILSVLLSRASEVTENNVLTIYYFVTALVIYCLDEFVFFRRLKKMKAEDITDEYKFPSMLLRVRNLVYIFFLSVGGVIDIIPPALLVCIFFCIVYIIIQDALFCDIFDTFMSYLIISAALFFAGVFLFFIQYKRIVNGIWVNICAPSTVLGILACDAVHMLFAEYVKYQDQKYNQLLFKNEEINNENEKLIEFREKVEKVNSDINYQKISLSRAYEDLADNNNETRSLIEVMKYFSSSFDIEKNAEIMVENVMKIKNAKSVGIYISKDVYMNDDPFLLVKAENQVAEDLLSKEMEEIYSLVAGLGSYEPVVLCENREYRYRFLTGGFLSNAVAFPAFENKRIYGVMVVTSGKYDFFINGFSFYESAVMDFTSALISDRLYLQTEDMAKKDGLTKLYNRTYFNQFYPELKENVVSNGDVLTVAMMDIDHFKKVNDTYGHLAGDEVIKMVGSLDKKYAKKYQGYAARFGGEEFLLILRNIGVDEAYEIINEMHDEIMSTVVEFEGLEIKINTSIGVASYKETCDNIDELVDRADRALYYGKTHGRGRIIIDGREEE